MVKSKQRSKTVGLLTGQCRKEETAEHILSLYAGFTKFLELEKEKHSCEFTVSNKILLGYFYSTII